MSLIHKYIQGTRYADRFDTGRASNDAIMQIQEPVGHAFFMPGNIAYIRAAIKQSTAPRGYDRSGDAVTVMLDVFYQHGSAQAGNGFQTRSDWVDPDDTIAIMLRVNHLNQLTLDRVLKDVSASSRLHTQYNEVMSNPKQVGPNPMHEAPTMRTGYRGR